MAELAKQDEATAISKNAHVDTKADSPETSLRRAMRGLHDFDTRGKFGQRCRSSMQASEFEADEHTPIEFSGQKFEFRLD